MNKFWQYCIYDSIQSKRTSAVHDVYLHSVSIESLYNYSHAAFKKHIKFSRIDWILVGH